LAIGLVIVAHAFHTNHPIWGAAREAIGEEGVGIFFVLSGYLITTLLLQERERTGSVNIAQFWIRRARRIFPAFYVYLAVIALIAAAQGKLGLIGPDILRAGLYLRDYQIQTFSWLEHTWSLAVETQFYLIWPAVFLLFGNRAARFAAIACIAIEPLVRIVNYFAFASSRDLMSIAFHTRADALMFGAAAALLTAHGIPAWLHHIARSPATPALCLLLITACIAATGVFHGAFQFSIGMTLEGIASAVLLLAVVDNGASIPARLLASSPATWLGRISYSLYLWQQPFLFNHSAVGWFPLNVLLALAAACLSYYVVERAFFKPKPVLVTT